MMTALRIPLPVRRTLTLLLVLTSTTFLACGDDDSPTGPGTSGPSDVTIRLTHLIVFGTCEGSSGMDQVGDFIVEMRVIGPDGDLVVTPDPPSGSPDDLFQGEAGEVVPLDLEYVLDGALADQEYLQIWFEVSERDGDGVMDSRMRGTRGNVVIRPGADGSWDGITEVVALYGGSPCRIDFVVALEQ